MFKNIGKVKSDTGEEVILLWVYSSGSFNEILKADDSVGA